MSVSSRPSERPTRPVSYAVGREKIREYAAAVGETNPLHHDVEAARAAGYADVVAPPMFAVVYASRSLVPALFDPEVGLDFARMVHGGQDFRWGPLVVAGDEITYLHDRCGHRRPRRDGVLRVRVGVREPARRDGLHRDLDEHRQGRPEHERRATRSSSRSLPTRYVTVRYAGASGDFNPIHIDEEFAQQVGLPGRILHGLWTMAQVARAHTEAAGGPEKLKRLSVQFRGWAGWASRSRSPARFAR